MMSEGYIATLKGDHEAVTLLVAARQAAADPAQRGTEFRPVEGGDTVASGETLLVVAYAVLWVVLFAFVWISWRRQARIDARIGELERALTAARGAKGT